MSEIWAEYEELASSDDFNARERFMLRDDLPDELVQEILSSEGDIEILASLASNQNIAKVYLKGLYNYEYQVSEDDDPDLYILKALAGNPSVGLTILNELSEHEDEEVAEIAKETIDK